MSRFFVSSPPARHGLLQTLGAWRFAGEHIALCCASALDFDWRCGGGFWTAGIKGRVWWLSVGTVERCQPDFRQEFASIFLAELTLQCDLRLCISANMLHPPASSPAGA